MHFFVSLPKIYNSKEMKIYHLFLSILLIATVLCGCHNKENKDDKSVQNEASTESESAQDTKEIKDRFLIKDTLGKYGYIDQTGKIIIYPQFDYAEDFSEGLAVVAVRVEDRWKFGFIDKKGEMVIRPKFINAHEFSDGLAMVIIDSIGGWAYIDKSGEIVIQTDLKRVAPFHEGLAIAAVIKKR